MMGDRMRDHEAGVIIHEDCHVEPFVAAKQEGEDV
jgi:hypothetical protein